MPQSTLRIVRDDAKRLPKRIALTKTWIEKQTTVAGQRIITYDNAVRGLYVQITPTSKSFYLYRKIHGRPVRLRLGGFPDLSVENARKAAMKHLGDIVQGKDPRDEKRRIRQSSTLQELFDRYEKDHTGPRATAKTKRTDKSRFDTCFEDWKNRKCVNIREADVRSIHADLGRTRGHTSANRAVQLLRRMFNFARIVPNPAGAKAVNFFPEKTRDRFLLNDELPRFFTSLNQEANDTLQDFFYISLLTGARLANVEAMRWPEVDLKSSTWTIPGEKMKNGEPMRIHLVELAKQILLRRKDAAVKKLADGDARYGEWVFPSKRHNAKTPHIIEPKAAWKRILDRAKIKDLRVHDLRRTLGSWQALAGASLPIIGKSLGHMNPSTTAIYARLQLDPVRASVEKATTAILLAGKDMERPAVIPEPTAQSKQIKKRKPHKSRPRA